jgi:hypothetical protein
MKRSLFADQLKKSLPALFAIAGTAGIAPPGAYADGLFRPTLYRITVFEAGLQNSSTGERTAVFKNDSGVTIDLADPGTLRNLASGASLKAGTWDQIYSITSNTQSYAGSDGTGCHIRQGNATFPAPDNDPLLATNNAGLAGTRTVTFDAFNLAGTDLGPISSPSTADAGGRPISNQRSWLVSSSNPYPNGGGTINRILYLGNLASPITTPVDTVNISSTYDLRNSFQTTGGCARFNVDNVKFTISY